MIRGAIFDVDGTLLDSMIIWKDASARYLRSIGVTPEEDLNEIMAAMSIPEGRAYLKKRYYLSYSEEEISDAIIQMVQSFYEDEVQLKPGMKKLVEDFSQRGIRMAVATSSDKKAVTSALKRLEILDFFDAVYTCGELQTNKREPFIYEYAAKSFGCVPEETIVFEDAYHAVRTAKEAGFPVVALYDEANASDLERIRDAADLYLEQMDMEKVSDTFLI